VNAGAAAGVNVQRPQRVSARTNDIEARKTLSKTALAALAGRELPAHASREHATRQAEIRRLALALGQARRQLKDNRAQLLAIVDDVAPGLTSRYGVGPSAPRRPS
jgi:hypothetical protein